MKSYVCEGNSPSLYILHNCMNRLFPSVPFTTNGEKLGIFFNSTFRILISLTVYLSLSSFLLCYRWVITLCPLANHCPEQLVAQNYNISFPKCQMLCLGSVHAQCRCFQCKCICSLVSSEVSAMESNNKHDAHNKRDSVYRRGIFSPF